MKIQATKKPFAFIIMMMCFGLTQIASAQIHPDLGGGFPGDICNCKAKNYGCGTSSACYTHCLSACKPRTIKMVRTDKINLSAIAGVFIKLTQPENNSLNLFENKKSTLKLRNNSQTQFIQQIGWGDIAAINSTSN
jgi:hypothetical protein